MDLNFLRRRKRELCGESRVISGSIDFESITEDVSNVIALSEEERMVETLKKKIESRKNSISASLKI
jgi:hypothetical protein